MITEIISALQDLPNSWGYAGLFIAVLISTASIIYPLPIDTLIVFAGGSAGNPILVGVIAGVAGSIGELSAYFIARGGKRIIGRYIQEGEKYFKVEEQFKKYGFWVIPIFAATPLPMDLIGLAAGALKYDLKKFLLGVLIGKIPRYLLIAFAGYFGFEFVKGLFGA